jgi:hypothetical protein
LKKFGLNFSLFIFIVTFFLSCTGDLNTLEKTSNVNLTTFEKIDDTQLSSSKGIANFKPQTDYEKMIQSKSYILFDLDKNEFVEKMNFENESFYFENV